MNRLNKIWAALRIGMGLIFLWAFFDKVFGLGFATTAENAWLNGGSPTAGFLNFATKGPFAEIFQSIAGNIFVDWLFMLGLLCIGISLTLGIFVKLGSFSGGVMLLLMYLAVIPPEHHPVLDDHIIYILVMIGLFYSDAGKTWGLERRFSRSR